ncbi:MAG: hypothetical protein V2J07_06135 [Anaerolineae bacterium]|jgi:predicted amino acid-binding ACT domain protein|nr:hypothetical protein [Anaerolineae bacterium]
MEEQEIEQVEQDSTPTVKPGTYSPVTVNINDVWGAVMLGILSIILLVGWVRAEKQIKALLTEKYDRWQSEE